LFPNFIGVSVGCDHNMKVIGAAVYRVQFPPANSTMRSHGLLNDVSLFLIQDASVLNHQCFSFSFSNRIRKLPSSSMLNPAAFISSPGSHVP